jgi:hypothetical protein
MIQRSQPGPLAFEVVLRWPSSQAERWAIANLKRVAARTTTCAIVAIGSSVRSAHHLGSDVDFLVIADTDIVLDGSRPIDVDLRLFARSEVDQKIREGDDLLGWALRFGRTIFERQQYWTNLSESWAHRLPLPSSDVYVLRARRFERIAADMIAAGDFEAGLDQVIGMLTHKGRASLIRAGVYPASRPELPGQLREIGELRLADWLEQALQYGRIAPDLLHSLKNGAAESERSGIPDPR